VPHVFATNVSTFQWSLQVEKLKNFKVENDHH